MNMQSSPGREDLAWATGAPDKLPEAVRQCETMLTPVRIVDSGLNRQYYMTPESDLGFDGAFALATGNLTASGLDAIRRRQRFNLLKSVIDAYCAMVVQVPAIDVTTTGGSWAQRRSAEALGLFIDGVFAASGMKEIAWNCTIDSCLSRVAAVRVDEDGQGGISVKRILPHQLKYNPAEGRKPRHLFTQTPVPRAALLKRHEGDPDKVAAIKDAAPYKPDPLFEGIDGVLSWQKTDMVDLFEGWRTSDPGEKNGRYVSAIRTQNGGDVFLDDDEIDLPEHIVIPLRFSPSYSSFAGSPAGDVLMSYQAELDDFADTIKEAFVKGAVLRVLVPKGAEIDVKELDAIQGQILHHNPNMAPKFEVGATLPPEYIAREQVIIERAHEFMGISYSAALGKKADGISSGKGQREVAALAQNRLVLNMQTIQDWIVDVGKAIVRVADRKYDGKKEISVKVPGSKLLNRVKWSEIGYKEEDFTIHCDAINALSRHPAARIDEVLELVQGKILTEREGLKVIANKDLQAARDEAFSNEDFAEMIIDLALGGDYRAPDPYMGTDGLQVLIKKGRARYVQEMVQKKPSEHLNLLRQLIEAAKTELANAENSQVAEGPAIQAGVAAPLPSDAIDPAMAGGDMAPQDGAPMAVPGAGLPADTGAIAPPVPGQGLA